MSSSTATQYDIKNGAAWITLDRPDNRNALSAALVNELYAHLQSANEDDDVRSIVITGSGASFCAGADLKSPPGSSISGGGKAIPFAELLKYLIECPKPVIAAVNGAAFGGGLGLVAAADIVVTVSDAVFSFSEVKLGVIPAVISVVCVPKLGKHQASRLFLTGERFSGERAVEYGLAHIAVAEAGFIAAVEQQIELLNVAGPKALVECKRLIREIPALGIEEGFKTAEAWSVRMFESEEGAEGMAAFREKRKPNWILD